MVEVYFCIEYFAMRLSFSGATCCLDRRKSVKPGDRSRRRMNSQRYGWLMRRKTGSRGERTDAGLLKGIGGTYMYNVETGSFAKNFNLSRVSRVFSWCVRIVPGSPWYG